MKRRQIPIIIGLLVLIVGITATLFLIKSGTRWFTRATPEIMPKQVKFTNITDNSFSVSWITDEATIGFVKYKTTANLDQVAEDDRDVLSGQTSNFTTHHVTLYNLNSATLYQFKIGSAGKLFDNNGQNYQVTTAPTLKTPSPPSDVAYGNVTNQAGSPAKGAIVYLSLAGAITQSSLVKASGNWVIPLNLALSENLGDYAQYDKQATIEELLIQGGNQGTATVVTTTKNDSPTPNIILGQSYDFRTATSTPTTEKAKTTASSKFNLEEMATPAGAFPAEITIINPQEQEEISTQKPEIKGQGPAGKTLEITIESSQSYLDTIIVNASGNWHWTPPASLNPGEHTITVNYQDEQDQAKTLSRTFTVLAAGTSQLPSLTATPSGEATPSPSPSPSASPSSTASPSARKTIPSTESGVPTSGCSTPTLSIFIIGLALIIFGLFNNSLLKKKIF